MPENPTTALVKTTQPPALARVSNQLALTDKLLTQLQTDVQTLQQSETYQTISQLTDWDVYFAQKRQQLAEQLETLAV